MIGFKQILEKNGKKKKKNWLKYNSKTMIIVQLSKIPQNFKYKLLQTNLSKTKLLKWFIRTEEALVVIALEPQNLKKKL